MPFSLEEIPHLAHHNFSNALFNDTYQLNQETTNAVDININDWILPQSDLFFLYETHPNRGDVIDAFIYDIHHEKTVIMDDISLNDNIMSNIDVLFQFDSCPNHVDFVDIACLFDDEII